MSKLNFQQLCAISENSAAETEIQIKSTDRFYNNTISEKQRIKEFITIQSFNWNNLKSNPFKS
jgi:hypothetical protein